MWHECDNLTENPKFCSLSCGSKHQGAARKPKVSVRVCPQCEQEFQVTSRDGNKRFCSRSCAATFNNTKFVKRERTANPTHCLQCGKKLLANQRKYCSRPCQQLMTKNIKLSKWLSGEWDGSTQHGLSRVIRNYLIEKANHRCSSPTCAVPGGFAEVNPATGRVPLEVDHIDGDCYNNSPGNLIVLCPNCHALTPTYRALNKVSGRKYRAKYNK